MHGLPLESTPTLPPELELANRLKLSPFCFQKESAKSKGATLPLRFGEFCAKMGSARMCARKSPATPIRHLIATPPQKLAFRMTLSLLSLRTAIFSVLRPAALFSLTYLG